MANSRTEAVAELVRRLGHDFRDLRLLDRALTHASVGEGVAPQTSKAPRDNERMEFLGDRVLGLLVADRLHTDFPEADEGQLSSRLHTLVDKHACGRVGAALGIGEAVRLSPGETKSGGRRKEGVIADAVEAVLAAVYLDGGLDAARKVFERAWAEELARPPERALTNPKSALQEWSQGQGRPLPSYEITGRSGSDHAPTFTVQVSVPGIEPISASGRSRQDAEKAAAVAMLQREGVI
ncbi:ribonuclease III [Brevundimonas goettingensis]|uniref:Ribonuclease 3 n=1 Tax=Brevundimonas goettingensis TaxID=2774190 RepID=A0A975GX45_9CAUL|nr:ribonuclease III [Brevundimonas goettingensis]QTC92499.1 ribonuclease III [Brevundimonas goettingensis]